MIGTCARRLVTLLSWLTLSSADAEHVKHGKDDRGVCDTALICAPARKCMRAPVRSCHAALGRAHERAT